MAIRSTRQKIKDRIERMITVQQEFQTYLLQTSAMSQGRMPELEAAIVSLLDITDMLIAFCISLQEQT